MNETPFVACPACGWKYDGAEVAGWRAGLRCMNGAKPDCDELLIYGTRPFEEAEINTNGTTVWVNAPLCVGRFCRFSAEVTVYEGHDVARRAVVTMTNRNLQTGSVEWDWFVGEILRLHRITVEDRYRPAFAKEIA